MNVRYRVELDEAERVELKALIAGGKVAVRKVKRAQILLAAHAGQTDERIASNVGVGTSTVFRTKRHFVEGNIERALNECPRPGASRKLSGKGRRHFWSRPRARRRQQVGLVGRFRSWRTLS